MLRCAVADGVYLRSVIVYRSLSFLLLGSCVRVSLPVIIMSASESNSESNAPRSLSDLFSDDEDDVIYEPASEVSGTEAETETDEFSGRQK